MIVGYARISRVDQIAGFEVQIKELIAAGCEQVFKEQVQRLLSVLRRRAVMLQLAIQNPKKKI